MHQSRKNHKNDRILSNFMKTGGRMKVEDGGGSNT
jgi:hypothetical protein